MVMKVQPPPPKSVWSRSTRLLSLAAGVATQELRGRLSGGSTPSEEAVRKVKLQVAQAHAIVQSLGQLKGAAMKAGQFLSMELRDVLPPEVIEVLGALQDAGSTVSWDEIESILRDELGAEKLAMLDVDRAPLASASIGQVHRAVYTAPGAEPREVAIKVQFRGIADTIESDLAVLERVARAFVSVQLKNIDLGAVFTELRTVLIREADYAQEAQSLVKYRQFAHQIRGLRVPEVFLEVSTKRVLVMSFEAGIKLDEVIKQVPSDERKTAIMAQMLDLYFREFFDWGLVQTDANFANFLFRPEAEEIVLLDFGATREYPQEFRTSYAELLRAAFDDNYEATLAVCESLGLIDPRETEQQKRLLFKLMTTVLSVFKAERQPVNFQDKSYVRECADSLKNFYQGLQYSAPPAQLLFLHRKLGGVYNMGRALKTQIDITPYWNRLGIATN
jgi:aarF domain-containing kinase